MVNISNLLLAAKAKLDCRYLLIHMNFSLQGCKLCFHGAGEASASTMWDNNAWVYFYNTTTEGGPPFLIQDFLHALQPHARFIVMLRDPVERWDRNKPPITVMPLTVTLLL